MLTRSLIVERMAAKIAEKNGFAHDWPELKQLKPTSAAWAVDMAEAALGAIESEGLKIGVFVVI